LKAICNEQSIDGRTLYNRIEELHTKGFISKNEIPIIHKLREIGNTTVHEIRCLPMNKLQYALDIINHILKSIYVLPKINKRLKLEKVRPKKKATSSIP
jgi:hypothetical protein